MKFDHAGLSVLLRRSTYVEVLFHVCLGAGAGSSFPAGRREFLAGIRDAVDLHHWQFSMLRELASRNWHVMSELISRLARRHAALVARLEQGCAGDRAATDLAAGLDAVMATSVSVRRVLASYLNVGQLLRLRQGALCDAETWHQVEWILTVLAVVEATEATARGTEPSPGPAALLEGVVPEVILHTSRRQVPFLRPVMGLPWIHSPRALCSWLSGRVTSGSPPLDCTLGGLMPLFLLVPGLLHTKPPETGSPMDAD